MWKQLALGLVLLSIVAPASAQEEPQPQQPLTGPRLFYVQQQCDSVQQLMTNIAKYTENPLFESTVISQHVSGEWFQGRGMMFVNPDTGTFSFVVLYPDGTACMQAVGNRFEPYSGPMLWEPER